jgi:hypothetical protein
MVQMSGWCVAEGQQKGVVVELVCGWGWRVVVVVPPWWGL